MTHVSVLKVGGICAGEPHLPGEVHGGVSLRLVRSQRIIDILQVIEVGELRDPTGQHLETHTHTRLTSWLVPLADVVFTPLHERVFVCVRV